MINETHILQAAKLLKIRNTCRSFYGDKWTEKQAEYRPIIKAAMKKHNCDELQAGVILGKQLEGMQLMCLLGTVMEIEDEESKK